MKLPFQNITGFKTPCHLGTTSVGAPVTENLLDPLLGQNYIL